MAERKTIALDFDGTLTLGKGEGRGIPAPIEGARAFVQRLLDAGHTIVIFSHRAVQPEGVEAIQDWLDEHHFPEIKQVTGIKPAADVYVDDRSHRFDGDFESAMRFIESGSLEPWWGTD